MSITALNWAMTTPTGDPGAQLVLIILADYANENGEAWPSIETITKRSCQHRATVIRKLDVLKALGLIVQVDRGHRSNTYRVTLAAPQQSQDATPQSHVATVAGCDPSQDATSKVAECDVRGSHVATRTTIEPSLEPKDGDGSLVLLEGGFPTRVADGESLIDRIWDYAVRHDEQLVSPKSRSDVHAFVLRYALAHADTETAKTTQAVKIIRESYERLSGDALTHAGNKMLLRLIAEAGALAAYGCIVEAITAGAGLREEHEGDPLAVLKYANAIHRGWKKGASA